MKNSIKFYLCSLAAALLLCGCGDDGSSSSAGQNSVSQNSVSSNSTPQSVEQNHTAKPRISVKSGEAPKKKGLKLVK